MTLRTTTTKSVCPLYRVRQALRAEEHRDSRLLSLQLILLLGGLGPRVPDGLAALSAGFYPSAPAPTVKSPSQP